MKDYYRLLGVPEDANNTEVHRAFRSLAHRYHPDRNLHRRAWAEAKFKEINEAYLVLRDPHWRREYDKRLRIARGGWRSSRVYSGRRRPTGQTINRERVGQPRGPRPIGRLLRSTVTGVLGHVLGAELRLRMTTLESLPDQRAQTERDS